MPTGKLTVIVGLPGAGKSTLINKMRPRVSGLCCEDFHANAINDSHLVEDSRHYADLIQNLRLGRNCVIADIAFCDQERRAALYDAVKRAVPDIRVEWTYFENAPDKCRRNIQRRARPGMHNDLSALDRFAGLYQIPDGVVPIPVKEEL